MNKDDKVVKSTCRSCHGVCGVLVHMKGERVVKVTGDPDCPTSRGYMCAKGRASVEVLYHPDRLRFPLKRAGAKGENRWQRISWDEALDSIGGELLRIKHEYGAESIAMTLGTGRPYSGFFARFANCLGTPNVFGGAHICYFPRNQASAMTCGRLPICDFYGFGGVYPRCVVVWGCNIGHSGAADGMCGYQLTQAVRRGAKLVVVDPRKTDIASKADYWARIRPGTDDALALGMLHVIIREELYDKDFVENWTVGFDELAARVQEYPPEEVEKITWVPQDVIVGAARMYATTKPACIQWGVAVDQNINNFQTARALLLLRGITGNIDVPGGDVFWVPPANVVSQSYYYNPGFSLSEKLPAEVRARMIGAGQFPLNPIGHPPTFWDAVLSEKPYPVKAILIMGSNPLLSYSSPSKTAQALRKVDLVVVSDLWMTPSAQLADIVLPASSWLEQDDVADIHFVWCVLVRQKMAQIGECRDDKEIIMGLARRLGLGDYFPWNDVKDFCNWTLKDTGVTFDEFKNLGIIKGQMQYKKYEKEGFKTPSKKFELYCSALESRGLDPLPFYREPPESPYSTPELAEHFPLIITTGGRVQGFFHSEGRQVRSLRRLNPDPLVEIHPATARDLRIKEGDWVWIESARGKIRQRAHLADGIDPRVVHAQHGWWFPEKEPPGYGWEESNINLLTGDMPFDPHTGSESWRSFLCKVYRDSAGTDQKQQD